ncbi:MAG: hypothetical protein ACREBG_20800 [Pyrinomonadaceae bacterium]
MTEARERVNNAASEICDALRYMGDVSYAILPRDVAHGLGDLKKSFLNFMRSAIDKEVEWIDERVAGGDRLREDWKASCNRDETEMGSEPLS